MSKLIVDITMSLDGYVAGPDQTLDEPLGRGGEALHEWAFATKAWQEQHGAGAGEPGPDSDLVDEHVSRTGATIMGRRMFSGGEGPWESDPNADAWWGDEPPFHHAVFVLTHHAREPEAKEGGTTFTFVTDGIESALEQAREAAGDKDVAVAGGGEAVQQYLKAGLVDELHVHVAPMLLGAGARLFGHVPDAPARLECTRVAASPSGVAHLRYEAVR